MSRLTVVASVALAVPVVLLAAGLQKQAPARAEAAPIKVVRVTKVVRPVTVKRIVEMSPAQQQVAAPAPAPVSPRTTENPKRSGRTVVGESAPVQRESAPKEPVEAEPDSAPRCRGRRLRKLPRAGSRLRLLTHRSEPPIRPLAVG